MQHIEVEPILLKIKGGWLNPAAILSVETHRDNEKMLIVRVVGIERPIPLDEQYSAYVREYLDSRTWPRVQQEPQAVIADEATP